MNALIKICWFTLFCCCGWLSGKAQSSVLQTGAWYKLAVEKTGVHRISYDLLRKMGIDPGKVNPQNIRIFGRKGGMLPQDTSMPRPLGLVESAIFVHGAADGKFDKQDHILFYGEGADHSEYDVAREVFRYEKNLYSDQNFYFLTIGSDPGKRLTVAENLTGDFPTISTFNDFAFHELDQHNIERSGREWYGEKFGLITSHTLKFDLAGISAGSSVKVVSDVMGQSQTEASLKLFFNNNAIGEQNLPPVPNGRYSVKGLHKRDTLTLNPSEIGSANRTEQEVRYDFAKGTGSSQAFLNFVLINVVRDLALYNDQTIFVSAGSLANEVSTFRIGQLVTGAQVWDVTDHYDAQLQEITVGSGAGSFSATTNVLKKWVVFGPNPREPEFVSKIQNQDLSGQPTPQVLIITHEDFKAEAERLAAHRAAFNSISTLVVTVDQIYNEFSGGRQDVSALRDFAKHLRDKDPSTLRSILLFGRSSYDYKDRIANNTNFVPTYQSRNSLHPLQTYSSDDFFGFLEDGEGSWSEAPAQHHTLDVGVGRLPVRTAEEAANVVEKIIDYDRNKRTLGAWRKKIVFVADDGNSEDGFTNLHQYQADQLANMIEEDFGAFDTRRIFMGSYKKRVQPNGETVADMADDIRRSFDQGALIINFTGHGSELVWTDERVLTEKTIEALDNDRYPFLVTATCEFGRQDDPLIISTAERSVTKKAGGSIGLVTTARPVNATTNFNLNEAFYAALFEMTPEGYSSIGEVFLKTKNNSPSGVANRNFSLIGDPSMVLALPEFSIKVSKLKTSSGSDTLKALSYVTANGTVHAADGTLANEFNGVVEVTLFDKEREFVTIGKNDPPFEYRQWDNAVFRGKATVKNGEFELSFIMPKNIGYQVGDGKLSLYAYDTETGQDAKGVNTSVQIGGSEADPIPDAAAPLISLFMGDTTFTNGGMTTADTYLVAKLEDESGINISGYGIGNSIIATLDDDLNTFVLNDYYISDADTYQKGYVRFPVLGLSPGPHTITLHAWDVHNNPGKATIAFVVTDGEALVIETFGNYPNPFRESTRLFFTHNRSGDDLEAQLFIFTAEGQLINSTEISVAESEYHINLMELNTWEESGKKLPPGLYFARVVVRSMSNGSKNEKVTKLIVLN